MNHRVTRQIRRSAVAVAAGTLVALGMSAAGPQGTDLKSLPKSAIRVDGSSTVYPITEAVAEEFAKAAPTVNVTVGMSGTGGGFKRFCVGEIDISDASRPIKKSEADQAATSKVEYIELPIAYDGLTIVVNKANTWVDQLTVDQLKKIYSAAGGAKSWKDVNSAWPDKPIKIFSPGTDSGTFDYFREATVGKDGKIRSDMTVSEDDNVLVTGVAGDSNAIGYFGCAYYFENKDKVKAVPVVSPSGKVVMPSHDTIMDGSYAPFSRPLFIYVNRKAADRPEVAAFVDFYLGNVHKVVEDVGYVALPDSIIGTTRTNWKNRRTGTQFMDAKGGAVTGSLGTIYK